MDHRGVRGERTAITLDFGMLKVGFCLQDDAVPRTEYWERFLKALKKSEFYAEENADVLIPLEDTAIETNWPRYGNPASAYLRGQAHDLSATGQFQRYFGRIVALAKSNPRQSFLYVNMHPFFRTPLVLSQLRNIFIADISLATYERDLNQNTISMPASPIVVSPSASLGVRPILASFQGVNSHPIRTHLKSIANGKSVVVNLVERTRHVGKIDAVKATTDREYEQLLANSNFAFVPRGDALFSYRLIEAMSFGCIPIILSDGWVLPFDRTLPWDRLSLRVHADAIQHLPYILASCTSEDILSRQKEVLLAYQLRLASLDSMISGLIAEVEILYRSSLSI
jgi:hypothetical protein